MDLRKKCPAAAGKKLRHITDVRQRCAARRRRVNHAGISGRPSATARPRSLARSPPFPRFADRVGQVNTAFVRGSRHVTQNSLETRFFAAPFCPRRWHSAVARWTGGRAFGQAGGRAGGRAGKRADGRAGGRSGGQAGRRAGGRTGRTEEKNSQLYRVAQLAKWRNAEAWKSSKADSSRSSLSAVTSVAAAGRRAKLQTITSTSHF